MACGPREHSFQTSLLWKPRSAKQEEEVEAGSWGDGLWVSGSGLALALPLGLWAGQVVAGSQLGAFPSWGAGCSRLPRDSNQGSPVVC